MSLALPSLRLRSGLTLATAGALAVGVLGLAACGSTTPKPAQTTATCRNAQAGLVVAYPSAWKTNEASAEFPACTWFDPTDAQPVANSDKVAAVRIHITKANAEHLGLPSDARVAARAGKFSTLVADGKGLFDAGTRSSVFSASLGEGYTLVVDGSSLPGDSQAQTEEAIHQISRDLKVTRPESGWQQIN